MQRFAGEYFDANGVANYYLTDYQGNVTEVVNASGVVVQSVRYYPDGEPWMEPTGTNRYTFGGKERVNLGGLNQYDFGPRLLNAAAGVWGAPDPMAENYYGISPYSYCAGNPVGYVDPSGCSPLFSRAGEFLGTDDEGLSGQPYIINKDEFQQNMTPEKAREIAIPIDNLPEDVQKKINDRLSEFQSRPDYDGYLTYDESVEWYHNGKGENLYIDLTKLDLTGVVWEGERTVGEKKSINLFENNPQSDEGKTYGHITFVCKPDDMIRAYADKYDFEMHPWTSWDNIKRNLATLFGSGKAGKGTPYDIVFYGSIKLPSK